MKKKDETKEIYFVQESAFWSKIQDVMQNAVVQIVAQIGRFDWRQPYKIEELYESYGSGFIMNDQGYVITSMHVIHNAKYVWVYVPAIGRKQLDAQVISICPDRDIALLKINSDGLDIVLKKMGKVPIVTIGNSDEVQRSDNVLVLGYPLGKHHLKSATGIVAGREFLFGTTLLQITAPINPGNSGGPIFNIMGHVIGIAMAVEASAYDIGYAIPINELLVIIEDMLTNNIVRKIMFGARFINAADEKIQLLGNPYPAGWYMVTVFKGTLLDEAGVRNGDMLYEFDGYAIDSFGEAVVPWSVDKVSVFDLISRVKYGDNVKLVIYRNGERKDIKIKAKILNPFAVRERFPGYERIEYELIGGMGVMELARNHIEELIEDSPELLRYYHPEYCLEPALVITTILPGSYARTLRTLKPGDIIKQVNGVAVATLADFRKALRKSLSNGLLSIVVDTDILVVFSLQKIIADEQRLSEAFVYPISSLIKKLQWPLQRKSTKNVKTIKKVKKAQRGKNKKTIR